MSKMSSHDPFGHLQHKLWPKERPRVKLTIWLPTMGSRDLTRFPYVQVACNMPLESSWQGLQLQFILHPDSRSTQEIIVSQSCGTSSLGDFGTPKWTPIWESQDKKSFGCHSRGEVQSILYGGRWWLPSNPGRDESYESKVTCGSS
jgi:hypothetical protein